MMTGGVTNCDECGEADPLTGEWVRTSAAPFGDWVCRNCNSLTPGEINPYASKLISLHLLKRAGYHFSRDELDPADWRLLGMMEIAVGRAELIGKLSQYSKSMKDGGRENGEDRI